MITLVTIPRSRAEPGEARYVAADYTLTVGPGGEIPNGMRRLSIGTLTLFFDPAKQRLGALEAYTNAARWLSMSAATRAADLEAAVSACVTFDEHGIGPSTDATVEYYYAADARQLLITVCKGSSVTRVRCISCVVVELDAQGKLLQILIEPLQMVGATPGGGS